MDPVVGLAILVEDGVQRPPPGIQNGHRLLDPALLPRELWNLKQQKEGGTVVSGSELGFFRRMITKVAELITWIRRLLVLRVAKNGNLQISEGRRVAGNDIKVEEAASGACEPQLAEIIVSEKEDIIDAASNTVQLLDYEGCESNFSRQITVEHEQSDTCDNPTLLAENDVAAVQIECASPTRDPLVPKPADSDMTLSPELDDGPGTEQLDKSLSQGQDVSREEEFQDDGTPEKHLATEAPPGDGDTKLEMSVEESFLEQVTSSKSDNKKFSIHQLSAIVTKHLIKYLQALERSMAPATLDQNTTHHRAIILATLVAVVMWARNSKHLHESMPSISGSAINVHIRSRL